MDQNFNRQVFIFIFFTLILSYPCSGQKMKTENFSLFNPVPKANMREMETDRPDVTESPYTVDAGHIQFETDVVRFIKEKDEIVHTNTLLINQMNLKIGLANNTAIQIGFQSYGKMHEKELDSDTEEITSGHGDLTFRLKQNLIGNDKGDFALAVLPYIKLPISKYDRESCFEGGVIVPMSYKFAGEWKLGFQVEVDRLKDEDQPAMHTEFLQTLTISHPLTKHVDWIAETYYTYDFKAHHFSNFLNAAIQVEIFNDFKLDAGLNYGLQDSADKHFFFGASYRL